MELIILGSSGAIPTKERNLPALALKYHSEVFLFDTGENIQQKFIEAGLKLNKPLKILISHFHGDHIIGLPGLLFRFGLIERTAPITIFGPRNLYIYLLVHRKVLGLKANYPMKIVEIDHENNLMIQYEGIDSEVEKKEIKIINNVIFESKKYYLKFTLMDHSVISLAYSFVEKPRHGKFYPEKAKELGVPKSHLWKKMQEGHSVYHEGKTIDPLKEGIVGPKKPGRKITYSGDTMPCESLIELGMDSDILIHESTFAKDLTQMALEKKHSTSVDAAEVAKKMNAKQLILTHISSRYQEDASKLLEEAKKIFPNTILAEDLLKITLK